MQVSKHNIISKIQDRNDYIIVNALSGQADILTQQEHDLLLAGQDTDNKDFWQRGYLVDPAAEKNLYRQKYLDFLDEREDGEAQLFFVPTYACNFKCAYCYQDGYKNEPNGLNTEVIDAFFSYVNQTFSLKKHYITLFGGEPLLNAPKYRENILYFLTRARELGKSVSIVTNGYNLQSYLPYLHQRDIREIQVTLDGIGHAHDTRRPLLSGEQTYQAIVQGIDAALKAGFTINLRVVVDAGNIDELPKLAKLASDQGWTSNPLFKTQLGRNYELHYCQDEQNKLYTRLELYKQLYNIIKEHPGFVNFHKPAFSISKFLFDNGKMPAPLFDSCPGTKNEWAFDYTGKMYACTATVGKHGEELGSFYPKPEKHADRIAQWEERDVLSIHECKQCNMQLICGGGCAAVAKNNSGKLQAPDCRPHANY
ncbi:MAG: radical SAM protein [Bacteroidales bacterium]|nr:radical SAM protein [Bacteroidales bacterium]